MAKEYHGPDGRERPDNYVPDLGDYAYLGLDRLTPVQRRKVLATGGLLGGVGTIASTVVTQELEKQREGGVDTRYGLFTGIYEPHIREVKLDQIPTDLDAYSVEYNVPYQRFIDNPRKALLSTFGDARMLPDDVLLMLAKKQIPLILGDSEINEVRWRTQFTGEMALGPIAVRQGIKMLKQEQKASTVSRRRLLEAGAMGLIGAGLWGSSTMMEGVTIAANVVGGNDKARKIIDRLADANGHLHPEDEKIFFRNVMIADKLLTVGEKVKEISDVKPHIGFQLGPSHTAVEDFLRLGPDVCRSVITAYPDWFLKGMAERNGGIHQFSSALLYQLPENLTAEDLHDPNKPIGGKVHIITDTKLERKLSADLG